MKTESQLVIPEANEALATTTQPEDSLHSVLSIIERAAKDPTIDIDKMERLLAMAERMQTKDAERQFNAAFVKLQGQLPVIVAETVIPNRGKYERFEDICRVVNPLLFKHGFTVSFSMAADTNRITETCHLKHTGGHSQSNSFSVRVGGKADSETQADCKAATTAKRNALLNCLNIVIRQDVFTEENDDTQDGAPISWEQVAFLKERVKETGANEEAFLKFAGVFDYTEIGTARYPALVAALEKKAKK